MSIKIITTGFALEPENNQELTNFANIYAARAAFDH
jgi:hypothetical protein